MPEPTYHGRTPTAAVRRTLDYLGTTADQVNVMAPPPNRWAHDAFPANCDVLVGDCRVPTPSDKEHMPCVSPAASGY